MGKKQKYSHKNSVNSSSFEPEETSTRSEKSSSVPHSSIETTLFEQLLWWQIKIPVEVVEMLSIAPKVTRSEDSSSKHQLLKWLTKPENARQVELSSAWRQWFKALPDIFFDRLDGKQLVELSAKIETVLMTPKEVIGLTQEIKTDFGKREFFTQLHCLIEPDEIKVWANLVEASGFSPTFDAFSQDNNSVEFFYERQALMEEQNKVIKSSFQKQSRFLAMLSHELRSPLLGLQAMAKRLAIKYKEEIELQNSFESMSSTVEYLSYLINDILTYSQTEFNSVQLYPHEFDLQPLLKDVEMLTKDIANQKQLYVKVNYKGDKQIIFGDRVRLKQVFLNLVVNAIKFTETGGVILEAEQVKRHEFLFKIKDTGEGISKDKLNRIFEPFMQLDSTHANNQFGAGLGLFVVKQLIELMGGSIQVNSELGVGTEFSFRLNLSEYAFHSQQLLDANVGNQKSRRPSSKRFNQNGKLKLPKSDFADSESSNEESNDILDFVGNQGMVAFNEPKSKNSGNKTETRDVDDSSLTEGGAPQFREGKVNELDELDALMESYSLKNTPMTDFTSSSNTPVDISPDTLIHSKSETDIHYRPVNVLIAEDSDLNRWVLTDMLKEFNCKVTETVDGVKAWEAYQNGHFDIVMLDIQMPYMSGIDVARNIRNSISESGKLPPIVAVTAGGDEFVFQNDQESLDGIFDDWLLKPVDLELIKQILERHLLLLPELATDSEVVEPIKVEDFPETTETVTHSQAKESPAIPLTDAYEAIPQHLLTLFNDFVVQTTELLTSIESGLDKQNWELVAKEAHKLKGNMMLFQLNDAAGALKNLELTVKSEENPDFKQEKCHELCQNLRTLLKALEKSHSMVDN